MYTSYFALTDKPFNLTPDPEFLYLSKNHKEALAHLTYGVESKTGFVMVTGEVGAGKTTLLRTLIQSLVDRVDLSQVTNTRVSYKELLEMILEDFGLSSRGLSKTALLSELNEFLIERYRDGRNCVVIIDEAQNLGVQTLEGLRMLSNLETEKSKLLHIILAGQPGLRELIDSPELVQMRQRITVRYHLGPLSAGEVGEYIQHRLNKVISDPDKAPVIPDEVIPAIHQATQGIPRLINVLCDSALLHGYVAETRHIGPEIVDEVAAQIVHDQEGSEPISESFEDPEVRDPNDRIAQLEARLEKVVAQMDGATSQRPASSRAEEHLGELNRREKELRAREEEIETRVKELEERELDFNDRLARVKEEWKKRMNHLQGARKEILGGKVEFPPLRVCVYDADPRIRNSIAETLRHAGVAAEVYEGFQLLLDALLESSAGACFPIAVVGSGTDDGENEERLTTISTKFGQVPTVFLSDIDLSTIRRRIFAAGANYFVEKPNGRASSFTFHREAMDTLGNDLVRVVQGLHRQYQAFFEVLVGENG